MLSLTRALRSRLTLSQLGPHGNTGVSAAGSNVWNNATAASSRAPAALLTPWLAAPTAPGLRVEQFHSSASLERARQGTRLRKRKVALANKRKKELRLKKNPPPLPKKVKLMLRAMGVREDPLPKRYRAETECQVKESISDLFFQG